MKTYRKSEPKFNIWDGIYRNFNETNTDTQAFNSNKWQAGLINKTKHLKEELNEPCNIPEFAIENSYPLPVLISMLDSNARVLDFGGGLGTQYLQCVARLPKISEIQFDIVETIETVSNQKLITNDYKNVTFSHTLPPKQNYDVIHIGSTLQYIEDWFELLKIMQSRYNPVYFVFSDLMAGDIPSFASRQYYYGEYIATWFFNLSEFIASMEFLKFRLTYKSLYEGVFLNQIQELPMNNFPRSHRLKHACNLVFKNENT